MKKMSKKYVMLFVLVLVILTGTIGGTYAYIIVKSDTVRNTFTVADCDVTVIEQVDDSAKKSIKLQNTGDVPEYMRVAIVGNYVDEDGNIIAPWNETIALASGWEKAGGFYYCKTPVAIGALTPELLQAPIKCESLPDGAANLVIDVLAQAVQAEPIDAVTEVWGYTPSK